MDRETNHVGKFRGDVMSRVSNLFVRSLFARSLFAHLGADRRGNVAVLFSLSLLPMLALTGAGYEFLAISNLKSQLQAAADAGALRAARELRLARSGVYDVTAVVRTAAQTELARSVQPLSNVNIAAILIDNASAAQVTISATYQPTLMRLAFKDPIRLGAQAVARSNGFPICALGLDPQARGAIHLEANAKVTAQYCAVQSNSKHPQGLSGADNSLLTAGMICSAGGKVGKRINFAPDPLTDCPIVADPLASRAAPPVGGCAHNNEVITAGAVTLMPGTYCGGLKITAGAVVTLSPGEYVMKDGPLVVDGGSSFRATNAGVFLTGANATFKFATDSSISMSAPTSGPLAGMLFFEDHAAPTLQQHEILSDDAPFLLGTIYLPQGRLIVNANKAIAQSSAFTIIVAMRMELYGGPNLILNSDYNSTNVPVPGGLNPGYSYLTR